MTDKNPEADLWYKRYDEANRVLKTVEARIKQINIWDSHDQQMDSCVRDVKKIIDDYKVEEEKRDKAMYEAHKKANSSPSGRDDRLKGDGKMSRTYQGIADAMADQWGSLLKPSQPPSPERQE